MDIDCDELQNEQIYEGETETEVDAEEKIEPEQKKISNGAGKGDPKTKGKARRSTVWNFFDKVDDKAVICRLCRKSFKFCGNTTNLNSHIKRAHSNASLSSDHKYEVSTRKRTYSDIISDAVSHYATTAESENNAPIQIVYSDPTHAGVSTIERAEQYVRGTKPLGKLQKKIKERHTLVSLFSPTI